MRRPLRRQALTALGLVLAALSGGTVAHATASGEDDSPTVGGRLALVGQSPWIDESGVLTIDLRVSGSLRDGLLTLRFHEALDPDAPLPDHGDAAAQAFGAPLTMRLADHLGTGGIASLEVPVGPGTNIPVRPGVVHPISILLTTPEGGLLDSLSTVAIVLPSGEQPLPLLTGIVVEIAGPPPLQPDGSLYLDATALADLRAVVDAIADHPMVPLDLRLPPATIVGLARSGDPADADLLADLAGAVGGGVRLMSTPFVSTDLESWRQSDRLEVFRDLLDHGDLVVADRLGTTPDRSIVHLDPTAVAETLDALSHLGSQRFLVDAGHLDTAPSRPADLTRVFRLRGSSGAPHTALVVDPALSGHLAGDDGPVGAVQRLLADLALRSWAEPNVPRVSVLVLPDELPLDRQLLDVLLDTLGSAPFVDLAPLPAIFASVQVTDEHVESGLWPVEAASVARKVASRGLAEVTIDAYAALVGGLRPEVAELVDLLESTAADEIGPDDVDPYIRAIYEAVLVVLDGFDAPADQNVRLTTRTADVPYTLVNELSVPVEVMLRLESDGRLDFPEGDQMTATLRPGTNRILIPVESRTSGDARLQVTVRSPDEAQLLQLQSSLILVRSTHLSGVGVFLLVGALLVLAVWWTRSARRGPDEGTSGDGMPDGGSPGAGARTGAGGAVAAGGSDGGNYAAPDPGEEP